MSSGILKVISEKKAILARDHGVYFPFFNDLTKPVQRKEIDIILGPD
jgi:hypothetical protein